MASLLDLLIQSIYKIGQSKLCLIFLSLSPCEGNSPERGMSGGEPGCRDRWCRCVWI